MPHALKSRRLVQRFLRWLFGAPFEQLPPEFGDPVPPEVRIFEAEAEEGLRHEQASLPPPSRRQETPSKAIRTKKFSDRR
ncbi:MAG TPA: hypothetical protein DEP84_18810 [Chloroflexi bacterium]|nr:hypothetical protein [Chloroflexota bacterium]